VAWRAGPLPQEDCAACMSSRRPERVAPRAPYAVRAQSWTGSTSSAYGEAIKGKQELIVQHKKDLDTAFDYIRWHGAKPGVHSGSPSSRKLAPESSVMLTDVKPLSPGAAFGAQQAELSQVSRPDEGQAPHNTLYGSGLYPHASRGKLSGSQPTWSFERMPSLLPQPLARGRKSCGVAPPDSSAQWPSASALSIRQQGLHALVPPKTPPTPGSATDMPNSQALTVQGPARRSALRADSEPRFKGMHGMIGVTWDDARRTAGDRYGGSSGEFLGF